MRTRVRVREGKSGEWFRGKGGLELSGMTLSHGAEPGKALQCLQLPDGRGLCLCISHPPSATSAFCRTGLRIPKQQQICQKRWEVFSLGFKWLLSEGKLRAEL